VAENHRFLLKETLAIPPGLKFASLSILLLMRAKITIYVQKSLQSL